MPHQDDGALQIVERLIAQTPPGDERIQSLLAVLRDQLLRDRERVAELAEQNQEYEEAYRKLTSPANRLAVFLEAQEDGSALVVLGDSEYVSSVDPSIELRELALGERVKLNDAYAIIGRMPRQEAGTIVGVSAVLDDGRLRVGNDPQNTQGRIVLRGAHLVDAQIQRGDEVRLDPSGRVALEHLPRAEVKDYFVEDVPDTPWSSIGGQEDAIDLIRETIEHPLLYPDLYARFDKKPVKGILLFGPPGCGKTLIGKAIAYNLAKEYSERVGHEVHEYFMHISGPKILNMWLGETERMVREIFDTARMRAAEGRLVVVFIDEAESVLRTRSSGRWLNISNTVVPQFCAEMDGLVSLDNVVLILTSNRPDYIDPAILRPERIDRKIKVRRPNREATREIFSIYLRESLPLDPDLLAQYDGETSCARKELIEAATAHLWRATSDAEFLKVRMRNGTSETLFYRDLVSGALIKSVVDRAKETAIRRAIAQSPGEHGISAQDLCDAIDAEYAENEIFPKSDAVEDWVKLLDLEPESVVEVRAIRGSRGEGSEFNPVI